MFNRNVNIIIRAVLKLLFKHLSDAFPLWDSQITESGHDAHKNKRTELHLTSSVKVHNYVKVTS